MLHTDLRDFSNLGLQILFPDGQAVVEHAVQEALLSAVGCTFKFGLHHPCVDTKRHVTDRGDEIYVGLEFLSGVGDNVGHAGHTRFAPEFVLHLEQFRGTLLVEAFFALSIEYPVAFLENGIDANAWIVSGLSPEFDSSDFAYLRFFFERKRKHIRSS